jgi:hypothetical protein
MKPLQNLNKEKQETTNIEGKQDLKFKIISLENHIITELTNEMKNVRIEEKNESYIEKINKNFDHLLELGEFKFRISGPISSFEEYEKIIFGMISSHLVEGRKPKIEYLDSFFNEWTICDDLKMIPEIGRIRITFQGLVTLYLF